MKKKTELIQKIESLTIEAHVIPIATVIICNQ